MGSYIVTIADVEPLADPSSPRTEAVLRVETGAPEPRIAEMAIRSTTGDGLRPLDFGRIDLLSVVTALAAGVLGPQSSTPGPAAQVPALPPVAEPVRGAGRRRNPDRPYRRMPEADEVLATLDRLGTVTAVAEHYGVPRHTAQGWVSRIRKSQGTSAST
jgi:hypothetical protein